jgi:hypothetical protein
MLKRLEQFVEPFAAVFIRHDSKPNARMYPGVLLSDVDRKNVESIAYQCDRHCAGLQCFIGLSSWPHRRQLLSHF